MCAVLGIVSRVLKKGNVVLKMFVSSWKKTVIQYITIFFIYFAYKKLVTL